jgi:DNA-binding transcriptional regulator YdaS (Cro superfamily)
MNNPINLVMTREDALKRAIEIVGSPTKLAKALGVTQQAVSSWRIAPVRRVLDIEKETGVSRHSLRPDFYPRERR